MANYLERIGDLLRLAERSDTPKHEAENAWALAQRIGTSHSISLEVARQHQADKEKRETPIQKHITLGRGGKKGLKHYVNLFTDIGRQNDVKCNIAHNSTYVIAFGFPSDIEVAELLYASLVIQMVEASDKYLSSGAYKADTVEAPVYETYYDSWEGRNRRRIISYKQKPVDGRVARANFQEAFIATVSRRLFAARQEAIAAAEIERTEVAVESTGTELVLANKALEVNDFYKQKSNAKGSWQGNRRSNGYSGVSRSAGRTAGENVRLSSQRAIGGGQRQLTG